ncbi:MAG: HAD family hydrolase [Acidiferrobacterales bacterium]|nr:HAD family hydrolase [Acidiferrobacterales bacterium]
MKSIVLLDYDGVIVDSIDIFARSVRIASDKLNQPTGFTPDDLRNIQRMTIGEISDRIGVGTEQIPKFLEFLDQELDRVADEVRLFPNMKQVIRQLSHSGTLAIVSATPAPIVSKVLANHAIERYFDDVIGGDSPGAKSVKIKSLIKRYDSASVNTCMVGDTVSDIEEGIKAGVATIAVSWGWHPVEHLLSAEPDGVAHQPEELIDLTQLLINPLRAQIARQPTIGDKK